MIFVGDRLVATNMGADHLGIDSPDDTMFVIEPGRDYGWPHCYHQRSVVRVDPQFPDAARCAAVPKPTAVFPAHSAPLGLAHFATSAGHKLLRDSYLVALQGAFEPGIRRGFKVVRIDGSGRSTDFITGFMSPDGTINGRPCGILPIGPDCFLLSDEKAGLICVVFPTA
jgi:glucose/arabinose dehydrogenase